MKKRILPLLVLLWGAAACSEDLSSDASGDRPFPGAGRGGSPTANSPEFQEVSVKAYRVERQPISTYILSNTTLEPIRSVSIVARVSALVEEILVEEGDRVRAGQLLVRLDDREIRNEHEQARIAVDQAEIQARQAQVRADQSKANHERSERLRAQKLISQQDYDQTALTERTDRLAYEVAQQQHVAAKARLEAAGLQLEYTEIHSSIRGVVTQRLLEIGDRVTANQVVFQVEDFDPIWARIFVPERDLPSIGVGQAARVAIEAFPGQDFLGRVKMINPRVDSQSGTVKVTLEMNDPQRRLRPGMFGLVHIPTATHENALVAPKKAILRERDENRIFVIKSDNTVEKRAIQIGISEQDRVEIVSGLEEGEVVVTVGQESLNDGYPVRVLAWEARTGETLIAATAAPSPPEGGRLGTDGRRDGSQPAMRGAGQTGGRRGGPGGEDRFQQMLDSNPELKKEYEKRLADDPELATDPEKRRAFFREMFSRMRTGRGRQ